MLSVTLKRNTKILRKAGFGGLLAAVVLTGCDGGITATSAGRSPTELPEALVEFRPVPLSRAFVSVPEALVVLERDLGGVVEQRITLPNATSLAGENVIILRAQTSRAASRSRLVLSDVLTQFGGAPTPFSNVTESGLTAVSDSIGDVIYTAMSPGADVTCVLAFRRTQTAARALPRGASSLDLMTRNCVAGSTQAALAPIGERAFGLPTLFR